jgi:AraC-like DNA-binding protein
MNEIEPADLLMQLSRSRIYQDYKRTFGTTTTLQLELASVSASAEATQARVKCTNSFCALLDCKGEGCGPCLQFQQNLIGADVTETRTLKCFAGFANTFVPVKWDKRVIGFLQIGQVLLETPNAVQFRKIVDRLTDGGRKFNLPGLKDAYYRSRTVAPNKYDAIVRLLEIFAEHLSLIAHKIVLQQCSGDSVIVRRAKEYIASHQFDPIHLEEIAHALNVSTFHFCRIFKQATGLTFVAYLSRLRVEKAKILLQDKSLRITEIAYEVGFQSLTHFNRIFRKLVGSSPTEYRSWVSGPAGMQGDGTL